MSHQASIRCISGADGTLSTDPMTNKLALLIDVWPVTSSVSWLSWLLSVLCSSEVFSQLLQQLQAACRMLPSLRPVCSPERVTLFQVSVYLKRWSIQDLGEHISRLSKEGTTNSFIPFYSSDTRTRKKYSTRFSWILAVPWNCGAKSQKIQIYALILK